MPRFWTSFALTEPLPIPLWIRRDPISGGTVASSNPVVAGKVDPNTRQLPVLKALLAGSLEG